MKHKPQDTYASPSRHARYDDALTTREVTRNLAKRAKQLGFNTIMAAGVGGVAFGAHALTKESEQPDFHPFPHLPSAHENSDNEQLVRVNNRFANRPFNPDGALILYPESINALLQVEGELTREKIAEILKISVAELPQDEILFKLIKRKVPSELRAWLRNATKPDYEKRSKWMYQDPKVTLDEETIPITIQNLRAYRDGVMEEGEKLSALQAVDASTRNLIPSPVGEPVGYTAISYQGNTVPPTGLIDLPCMTDSQVAAWEDKKLVTDPVPPIVAKADQPEIGHAERLMAGGGAVTTISSSVYRSR